MADSAAKRTASEDEPGETWDRCIADSIIKTGIDAAMNILCGVAVL